MKTTAAVAAGLIGLSFLTVCPSVLSAQSDTTEARRIFLANIAAIHHRDRAAYLGLYLDSPSFARNGPGGLTMGYQPMAASRDTTWPDSLIATDLKLIAIRPGVVYGQYRYRVTQRGVTSRGTSERIFVRTAQGWKIAVSTAFDAPPGTPPAPVALLGATLIDGTGAAPVPNSAVLVAGGTITCAGTRAACPVPEGTDTMNVSGTWITPGLIDAHVHFSQTGWVDGRPDALDLRAKGHPYDSTVAFLANHPQRYFRAYTCSGVTGVFDVGGYEWTYGIRGMAERDLTAPHVAAAWPLLSTVDHWINLPDAKQILYIPNDSAARAAVRANLARGADAVKVWWVPRANADTTAIKAWVAAAADETHRLGARLIVHATGLWEAKQALRAGADVLVHGVMDVPVDDEFIQLARQRHVVYIPTITVVDGYAQVARRHFDPHYPTSCVDPATMALARATDTIPAGDSAATAAGRRRITGAQRQMSANMANLMPVFRAGITIATGTDAGNPLTLHGPSIYWEMQMMQQAGMSPMDILVATTKNGAIAMNRADIGTIARNQQADLLVLDADPLADIGNISRIRLVMRGGALETPRLLSPR